MTLRTSLGSSTRAVWRPLAVGIALLLALTLLLPLALAATPSFPDVPPSHPYQAAILDLASRGIILGYGDGRFGPGDPVLRQQFAKMAVLAGGYAVSSADICPFGDVEVSTGTDLYPDHYVAVAAARAITLGKTPTLFAPYDPISRYQVISMVVRAADDLSPALLSDPPASWSGTPGWADNPTHGGNARRAEYHGLLLRLPLSALDPWGDMPRGEVAQVLHNLLQLLPPTTTTTTSTSSTTTTTTGPTTTTTTEPGEPFEEHPYFDIPNLAVTGVWPDSERTDPEEPVTFTAMVENRGEGDAAGSICSFLVDGEVVYQAVVGPLGRGASTSCQGTWYARGPGRHQMRAEVSLHEGEIELETMDNWAETAVWVAGEAQPVPYITIDTVDFTQLQLNPGDSTTLTFRVQNPSFAQLEGMAYRVFIDGLVVARGGLDSLPPGGRQYVEVSWNEVTSGEHLIKVALDLPPDYPDVAPRGIWVWECVVAGVTALYSSPAKDTWVSMGPSVLKSGSAGRMQDLAFHPQNPDVAYAVSEVGGIWKTTTQGASWVPLGDKLPTMNMVRIALDPVYPQSVYAASWNDGIWKSVDGGQNWTQFACWARNGEDFVTMKGLNNLVIRHVEADSDSIVIYVSCENGVIRYRSDDPWAKTTQANDWEVILDGPIWDIVVHPDYPSVLWAAVDRWVKVGDRRYETFDHLVTTWSGIWGDKSSWSTVSTGLPTQGLCRLDINVARTPYVLFAAVYAPDSTHELAIYRSLNGGTSWERIVDYPPNAGNYWLTMYNPFIRIHPYNPDVVFIAGTRLYRVDVAKALAGAPDHTEVVDAGHPDIKQLVFRNSWAALDSEVYWVLSDGGVWQVARNARSGWNSLSPRNNELRTIQFYDIDSSATDPALMIGGTQDNMTIQYQGSPVWREIGPAGDGMYALIAPTNNDRMYAQYQFLDSTMRTDNGTAASVSWVNASGTAPYSLPQGVPDGFISIDPTNGDHLLAVDSIVHETKDGGDTWHPVGPVGMLPGPPVRGSVTRVLFDLGAGSQAWVAGTAGGQLWYHTASGWKNIFDHLGANGAPDNALVLSLAFAPSDSNVLWAAFATWDPDRRVYRLIRNGDAWTAEAVSGQFPFFSAPRVICGDAYKSTVVYVGTQAGVLRGELTGGFWKWTPYNTGFPLAIVNDLLVDKTTGRLRAGTNGRGAWEVVTGP